MKINWKRFFNFLVNFVKALAIVAIFTVAGCLLFDLDFHWKLPIMNAIIYILAGIFLD